MAISYDVRSSEDSQSSVPILVAEESARPSIWLSEVAALVYLAATTLVVHVALGARYGFHPDELAMLEDSRKLAWGYPAYPPLTPFFGHLSLMLFGPSVTGFRFFAALAEGLSVLLAGLMARELGGRRGAQLVAAIAATAWCLGGGALMRYSSFDYFFWVLIAYLTICLLKSENPRWWIGIGTAIGFGLMTKYTMLVCAASLILGVLATNARRHLANRYFWYGIALAVLILLPNLLWQMRHGYVSVAFLQFIHQRDVASGRTHRFLHDQLQLTLLALPIWLAGLWFYLFARSGKRFRPLGLMYIAAFILLAVAKSRGYYLVPAYPMLYAAGGVWGEQRLRSFGSSAWALAGKIAARTFVWAALILDLCVAALVMLPLAPLNSRLGSTVIKINEDFREELGWPEFVKTVADVRNSLPLQDRDDLGILAGNYGEAGALSLYGPRFGLPSVISGVDSFWQHGYGAISPKTLIVVGFSSAAMSHNFAGCQARGRLDKPYGFVTSEVRYYPEIFVCQGLVHQNWPEFWSSFQSFE